MTNANDAAADENPVEPMPSPADFLLRTPLYREYAAGEGPEVKALQHWSGKVGGLCPICGGGSILEGTDPYNALPQTYLYANDRYFDVKVKCNWGHKEEMWFRFKIENKLIQKVGQWPSLADFALPEIARYRALLGKQRYADFSRAVRLAANGIGAGSFVYLRRVFEGLIAEARDEAQAAGELDEEAYARGRMNDRILLLRSRLPAFLVEHRGIYGILSVGVHELTEDQCLLYFDVVRKGIEAILDQHIEAARKADRLNEASDAVAKLQGELNHPKT